MYGKFVALVEEHLRENTRIDVELIGRRPASGTAVPAGQQALAEADEVLRALAGEKPIHQESSSTDANIPLSLGIAAHTVGVWRETSAHPRGVGREGELRRGLAVILALMLAHAADLPAPDSGDVVSYLVKRDT